MSKILLDYDSTLVASDKLRLQWVTERFGSNYKIEEITNWFMDYTEEEETFMWGSECFLNADFQAACEPVDGALEGVKALIDYDYKITVVSDRPIELYDPTRKWLDNHGLSHIELIFTHNKMSMSTDSSELMTKMQVAYLKKLKIVIEDAPHHAERFAEKEYIDRILLLDRPYNQEVSHEKITRACCWADIVRELT